MHILSVIHEFIDCEKHKLIWNLLSYLLGYNMPKWMIFLEYYSNFETIILVLKG